MQKFKQHLIRQDATHTNNRQKVFTPNTIESYLAQLTTWASFRKSLVADIPSKI
jgi:hypothetical protein